MTEQHSAEARFLSGDEGSALSAWVGAAIAMVGMLVAACAFGAFFILYSRHRNRSTIREVPTVQVKTAENGSKKPQAWPDPEVAGDQGDTVLDKASTVHADAVVPDKLSASVRLELAETLRGILEDEISRGLKASGISDRLDRLEQQSREQQVLSGSLLPQSSSKAQELAAGSDLDHTVKAQAGTAYGSSPELAATLKPEAKVSKRDAETVTDQVSCDAAKPTEDEQRLDLPPMLRAGESYPPHPNTLTPSGRQKRYPDPPEKGWMHVDEDRSLRMSLMTVQRNLQKRDGQTQELHRQLRQTEVDCQNQKLEATYAAKRLQDLLCDPASAPKVQAAEMSTLRKRVDDLSGRLADSKQSELHYAIVNKRQRAFFMQSERVAQEGVNLFRKHPAGELFLAPPPVYLEDDMDEDPRKPPWDIGNSHINPYANDSWPFEPNACAQRCAAEPNLCRWDEDEEPIVDSDSEEDGSDGTPDAERAQLMLRLPTMPPESPESPMPEDFEAPEPPTDQPEPLPALGALSSARSL